MDEVKVVYIGQDVSEYLKLSARHYFLQPCSGQNTNDVIAYIKEHPQWRLSLQTHNLEVPGSSPGWSTLEIKHLREIASAFFFICVNNA